MYVYVCVCIHIYMQIYSRRGAVGTNEGTKRTHSLLPSPQNKTYTADVLRSGPVLWRLQYRMWYLIQMCFVYFIECVLSITS